MKTMPWNYDKYEIDIELVDEHKNRTFEIETWGEMIISVTMCKDGVTIEHSPFLSRTVLSKFSWHEIKNISIKEKHNQMGE